MCRSTPYSQLIIKSMEDTLRINWENIPKEMRVQILTYIEFKHVIPGLVEQKIEYKKSEK